MTRNRATIAHIARVEASRDIIAQAAAEGRAAETALANWQYLFESGQYTKARAWWFNEVEPATRQQGS